ncbi:protein NKG7-like [Paroedura picta]|uniref:protein NKG7-like n=1 Tax=Paroedura picta TaxID=143630 RepID=UPI004057CA78
MGALHIGTAVFGSIGLSLLLAALVSDYWVTGPDHTGLWQVCQGVICHAYGMDVHGYIHATRFFLFVGLFAGIVSVFVLWALVCRSSSVPAAKIAAVASLVAGLCALVAMSIFTGVYNHNFRLGQYGWSLAVGWASGPLFLLTSGLAFQILAGRVM